MAETVYCTECGYRGQGEQSAEWIASAYRPDCEPSDVITAGYGACPDCGEALTWDWHADCPTLSERAEAL